MGGGEGLGWGGTEREGGAGGFNTCLTADDLLPCLFRLLFLSSLLLCGFLGFSSLRSYCTCFCSLVAKALLQPVVCCSSVSFLYLSLVLPLLILFLPHSLCQSMLDLPPRFLFYVRKYVKHFSVVEVLTVVYIGVFKYNVFLPVKHR